MRRQLHRDEPQPRRNLGRQSVALLLAAPLGIWLAAGSAPSERRSAQLARCTADRTAPLVFGIYPGGEAGEVGPHIPPHPSEPAKRSAALQRLRPAGWPFVLHLYAAYTGPRRQSAAAQLGKQIRQYTAKGFRIELVLTYRPQSGGSGTDVIGFARFATDAVRAFGSNPRFVALQITNEANERGAPDASDGYYTGAKDALIRGVISAKREVRRRRLKQVKIGFNWAYEIGPAQDAFWWYLHRHGGRAFVDAIDWVGLNVFPGTWGPPIRRAGLSRGTTMLVNDALTRMRYRYLRLARIPARVPLRVTENGYPTGPGRTEAMQVTVMKAAIMAIDSSRRRLNISDYRWFDLRDARSTSRNFQAQYGLLHEDYSPKQGFSVYRKLVAALSAPHPAGNAPVSRAGGCA